MRYLPTDPPDVRRRALITLARSTDARHLPTLDDAAARDPLPELRAVAARAAAHVRHHAAVERELEQRAAEHAPAAPSAGQARPRRRFPARPLLAGLLLAAGIGGVALAWAWFHASGLFQRYLTALGFEQERYDVTRWTLDDNTEYYVLIPDAPPPPAGYPALVVIHGSQGEARGMLGLFAERCRQMGVLLIAPTFPSDAYGGLGYLYHPNDARLNAILDRVWLGHPFQPPVLAGFSAGAIFSVYFATDYGQDLSGVALIALPPSELLLPLPARRDLQFWITAGDSDAPSREASNAYAARLREYGSPLWLEIVPGVGLTVSSQQVDMTMDLVADAFRLSD